MILFLQAEPKAAESGPQEGLVRVAGQSTGMPIHFCFNSHQHLHRPCLHVVTEQLHACNPWLRPMCMISAVPFRSRDCCRICNE